MNRLSFQILQLFRWFYLISSLCMAQSFSGILGSAESSFGISQSEDNGMFVSFGGNGCGVTCRTLEALGPPPDTILTIPPPPIPNFLLETLNANKSDYGNCNFCHIFAGTFKENIPQSAINIANTWICILIIVSITSIIVGAMITVFFLKCKKWKIFPVTDSCPILPESFLNNKHSSHINSSKSSDPQSISKQQIKESKEGKSKSSLKYWHRSSSQEYPLHRNTSQHVIGRESLIDSEECKSPGTPIYTELDVTPGNDYDIGRVHISDCSPYAVHTYAGIDNELQTAPNHESIGDGAYDNAAFSSSEGKKNLPNIQNYIPKTSLQSSHPNIPRWSNSVPASPMPNYPHRLSSVRKTYTFGRKAMKTESDNPTSSVGEKDKILQIQDTTPQFQQDTLPANNNSMGLTLDGFQKRPLPPIPLEHANMVSNKLI